MKLCISDSGQRVKGMVMWFDVIGGFCPSNGGDHGYGWGDCGYGGGGRYNGKEAAKWATVIRYLHFAPRQELTLIKRLRNTVLV
uniref:Uncharacterized protein n=1 Tax=Oryza barthii TaxID=65489 RepID=A0A0D3HW58_9ORYZ